jgi:hypothetical protein
LKWKKFKMKTLKSKSKLQFNLKDNNRITALKKSRVNKTLKTRKTSLEPKGEPKMRMEEIINVAFVLRHI